jgi:DNA polymerase-3 subunit beta
MKISVLQENLQRVIQDIQKSIPNRPALPILSCVLLEATEEKGIFASATDLNIGTRSLIQGEVITPGKAAVPAKIFMEYILSLNAGKIELSLEGNSLLITAEGAHATIQCFPAIDYPIFPEKEGVEYDIPLENFIPAIQSTTFSASVDESRPILTALLFSLGEKIQVVGTDGFRLSVFEMPLTSSPLHLLLPAKALNEVLRIVQRKKTELVHFSVSEKLKQVFFNFDDVEILVRLMDGEFPPYQKIIPPSFQTQFTFDAQEFNQRLKTALIFAREASGIIRLVLEGDFLKIISTSSTAGNQESVMKVQVISGGDQEIAFNAKYLTEFLSVMKPERIWFGMNESLKPAQLKVDGNENFSYIVMPFRVNQ